MQRYGFERGLLVEDSEHGQWVRYSDLAAARAEIERLTHLLDLSKKTTEAVLERAEKAEAERDEARAQVKHMEGFDCCTCGPCAIHGTAERDQAVAAAYEAAAKACSLVATDYLGKGADTDLGSRSRAICDVALHIRSLTTEDAKAALEAYGREKVREGMQRAADLFKDAHHGQHIISAILAEMEKLK